MVRLEDKGLRKAAELPRAVFAPNRDRAERRGDQREGCPHKSGGSEMQAAVAHCALGNPLRGIRVSCAALCCPGFLELARRGIDFRTALA